MIDLATSNVSKADARFQRVRAPGVLILYKPLFEKDLRRSG
jgi:hypothetical protein